MYYSKVDAGTREKTKLAIKTTAILVGGVLFLQGTVYLVNAGDAETQVAISVKPEIDYGKFKRPSAPPRPEDEVRFELER